MNISIITPYYKGSKFIKQYINILTLAINKIKEKFSYEIIMINDSPDEEIDIDNEVKKDLNIKIYNNSKNEGIHKSRINGIKQSTGDYILFLDQDDEITEDSLWILLNSIKDYDICIGNGYYEFKKHTEQIFNNKISGEISTKKLFYLYVKNFIVSPGQCLIRKNAIPKQWTQKTLTNNGADDYLLWLLMFNQHCKFKYVHKEVYIHKYTGENLSIQRDKMFNSNQELINILENYNYPKKDLTRLKASIEYKYYYKQHFIKQTLKHFIVFLYNLMYKIIWRGCIVTEKKLNEGE